MSTPQLAPGVMPAQPKATARFEDAGCVPIADDDLRPLYPAGVYEVRCNKALSYLDPQYRRWVVLLKCTIVGTTDRIVAFLNLGPDKVAKVGRRSHFWKAWCLANGGPPRKRQTMSLRAFEAKNYRVEVSDAGPSCDRYSKITKILECTCR